MFNMLNGGQMLARALLLSTTLVLAPLHAEQAKPHMWPGASGYWKHATASERADARCIVRHESLTAHPRLYKAENPTSTASGVMQAIDSTGRGWARKTHIKWRGHMSRHTHYQQDVMFLWGIRHNRSAWRSCR